MTADLLRGAEVLTDTDGSLWLVWKVASERPFEFHTLKLTGPSAGRDEQP